jgi:hypothetical protein
MLGTYDLLDNFAGGVQVDQPLMDLELVAVPGLRTLTARLSAKSPGQQYIHIRMERRVRTVLRVVILRTLVGSRMGPLTRSCLSFARLIKSPQTRHPEYLAPQPLLEQGY